MNTSMFGLELAYAAELIALVAGVFLIIYTADKPAPTRKMGRFTGWSVVTLSVFGLVCTAFYGVSYWRQGVFSADTVSSVIHKRIVTDERVNPMMDKMMMSENMINRMRQHMQSCSAGNPSYTACMENSMGELNKMIMDLEAEGELGH